MPANNGMWYKTGTGNGAGNWTQTSATLTPDASAVLAAASAAQAAISQASAAISQASAATFANVALTAGSAGNPYANAAATYVPQGVAAWSLTSGGTGGTNGTNILATFSGGTLTTNPTIRFDIVGGIVVNVRLVSPGLYIGTGTPTMPTATFPGAAGSPAITLTAGVLVPLGGTYWAVSSDSTSIQYWSNTAGSPAAVLAPNGQQVFMPIGGSLDINLAYMLQFAFVDNLMIAANVTTGQQVKAADGTIQTGLGSNFYTTDIMPCQPGEILVSNGSSATNGTTYGIAFYAKSGSAIVGYQAGVAAWAAVTVPANAFYSRWSFNSTNDPTATLEIRRSIARRQTVDAGWMSQVLYGVDLTGDKTGFTSGYALKYADGTTAAVANYYITNYMPCVPGVSLQINASTLSSPYGWCFYDRYKKFISGVVGTGVNVAVTPPTEAAYARCSFLSTTYPVASIRAYVGDVPVVAAAAITYSDIAGYAEDLHLQENLVDSSQFVASQTVKTNGTTSTIAGYTGTGWFAVNPGDTLAPNFTTDLVADGGVTYGWHFAPLPTGSITGVAGTQAGVGVTVPAGCYYARTSFNTTLILASDARIRRTNRAVGRLFGREWMPFGDSITAKMNGVWQQYPQDRLGIAIPQQDARGGRRMDQIFEMYQPGSPLAYGSPASGTSQGGIINATLPQAAGDGSVPVGAPQINCTGIWAPGNAVCMGYIVGTALTVTSVLSGAVAAGMCFLSGGAPFGTVISGSGSTWVVSTSQTFASSGSPQLFRLTGAWTSGTTLAADLAAINLVSVHLGTNDDPLCSCSTTGYLDGAGNLVVTSVNAQTGIPVNVPVCANMAVQAAFNGYIASVSGIWTLTVTSMAAASVSIQPGQPLMSGGFGNILPFGTGGTTGTGGTGSYALDFSATVASSGSPASFRSGTKYTVASQTSGTIGGAGTYLLTGGTPSLGSSGSPVSIALYGTGNVGQQQPMDGSYVGWLMWVFQAFATAAPSIKILPVIPMWSGAGGAMSKNGPQTVGGAQRAFYQALGLMFLDLQQLSGVSPYTEQTPTFLTSDKIHPTTIGRWNIGRLLTEKIDAVL